MEKFIVKFAELFDETEQSMICPNTHFKELAEWSSLMALSVIAMIDEEYGVTIGADELKSATTVEDLFTIIKGL